MINDIKKGLVYMDIKLNTVFLITKGNHKVKWKIVVHPYFPSKYAIVREHIYLRNGQCSRDDIQHLGYGGDTLEEAYKMAYIHT